MNTSTSDSEISSSDSFMEEAETHMFFTIAEHLNRYWFPILVPIGWFGNTLSFLVMIKPNNRKVSTCVYMAAISVNDNIMMCLAFHHWLISVIRMQNWDPLECHSFFDIIDPTKCNIPSTCNDSGQIYSN